MADEVLVKDALTSEMIGGGEEMTDRLVEAGWSVTAAFWVYSLESLRWRLVFGVGEVPERGSLEIYSAIQADIARRPLRGIDFSEIMVLQPDHPLVKRIAGYAERTGGTSPVRVKQAVIDGDFVEDALIYPVPQRRREAA